MHLSQHTVVSFATISLIMALSFSCCMVKEFCKAKSNKELKIRVHIVFASNPRVKLHQALLDMKSSNVQRKLLMHISNTMIEMQKQIVSIISLTIKVIPQTMKVIFSSFLNSNITFNIIQN